jgi:hypothetical protein
MCEYSKKHLRPALHKHEWSAPNVIFANIYPGYGVYSINSGEEIFWKIKVYLLQQLKFIAYIKNIYYAVGVSVGLFISQSSFSVFCHQSLSLFFFSRYLWVGIIA